MQPIAPGRGGSRKLPQQEVGARPECVKEGEVKTIEMKIIISLITVSFLLGTTTTPNAPEVPAQQVEFCNHGSLGICKPWSGGFRCYVAQIWEVKDCSGSRIVEL
jgi:hypothetical protein